MNRLDVETLGQYNAEKARGIVHSDEWKRQMCDLQREFDLLYGHTPQKRNGDGS